MRGGGRFTGVARRDALKAAALISQAFQDPKVAKITSREETVYRGIGNDKVFKAMVKLKEGDITSDKAFLSTSKSEDIAQAAAEDFSQAARVGQGLHGQRRLRQRAPDTEAGAADGVVLGASRQTRHRA